MGAASSTLIYGQSVRPDSTNTSSTSLAPELQSSIVIRIHPPLSRNHPPSNYMPFCRSPSPPPPLLCLRPQKSRIGALRNAAAIPAAHRGATASSSPSSMPRQPATVHWVSAITQRMTPKRRLATALRATSVSTSTPGSSPRAIATGSSQSVTMGFKGRSTDAVRVGI